MEIREAVGQRRKIYSWWLVSPENGSPLWHKRHACKRTAQDDQNVYLFSMQPQEFLFVPDRVPRTDILGRVFSEELLLDCGKTERRLHTNLEAVGCIKSGES